jgi:biopolymer transport protein ExbD
MKINLGTVRKARIEMLPLIDIVFLLLVFFIYAMLSMAVHRGLPVELPTSRTAELDKRQIVSVTIDSDGSISVNDEYVRIENLTDALKAAAAHQKEPGVLLFADRLISYQTLFQVLDKIRRAGISRISLQAEFEQEQ